MPGSEKLEVGYAHYQRCMYAAVLGALTGRKSFRGSPEGILAMCRQVKHLWVQQLDGLMEVGWPPLIANGPRLSYMKNCPYFGVTYPKGKRLRPCGRPRICPFCWGRMFTAQVYLRTIAAMEQIRADGDIPYVITFQYRIRYSKFGAEPAPSPKDLVARIRAEAGERHTELEQIPHCGSFLLHKIEPYDHDVYFSRGGVLVARGRRALPRLEDTRLRSYRSPQPKLLVSIVAGATRYPGALLLADSKEVCGILEETQHTRTVAFSGLLRKPL